MLSQTPTAFRQLSRAALSAGTPRTSLRTIVFGGERLEPAVLAGWIGEYGDQVPRLVNMFGITEITVHGSIRPITAADLLSNRSPIGRPLDDLEFRLLDKHQRPVRAGEVGELFVAGPGVASGYLNRAELTSAKFLTDAGGDGRVYRTGDLAMLDGGEYFYLGRTDDQLQFRGFRVEPGEVAAAIRTDRAVHDAVVTAEQRPDGEQYLVCYYLPSTTSIDAPAVEARLRSLANDRLPSHLRPSLFVQISAIPLTDNGKLNQAGLPLVAVGADTQPAGSGDESPQARLTVIWMELLGMDHVEPDADFFELGGDSLAAISMVAEAELVGIDLSIEQLFAHPTIAGLLAVRQAQ